MKILGYKVFPKKLMVTVSLKSKKEFFFYCDNFSFSPSKGFSYDGALSIFGSQLPGSNVYVDVDSVEFVTHKTVRLYRIYK